MISCLWVLGLGSIPFISSLFRCVYTVLFSSWLRAGIQSTPTYIHIKPVHQSWVLIVFGVWLVTSPCLNPVGLQFRGFCAFILFLSMWTGGRCPWKIITIVFKTHIEKQNIYLQKCYFRRIKGSG